MEKILLGLGSNTSFRGLGPCGILSGACRELGSFVQEMELSSVYRTSAMYVTDQDDFYNMVVSGFFDGEPRELLDRIHGVENLFGRDRSREIRFGPRPLDIDIELFGERKILEPDLVVPHERMAERAFVLVPYIEILRKNADSERNGLSFYENCLSNLSDQRIEKWMDSVDFIKKMEE
ncbi:MAG: 2-amino-4-hydroxy-6-hydroxymethyldihydropteridine diphosphokinase [Treponema sp.]|nr:2-amino-4-hydroxy-6-hydroxymethyldihydropteridine diphosphokinase [Treponema sp.]